MRHPKQCRRIIRVVMVVGISFPPLLAATAKGKGGNRHCLLGNLKVDCLEWSQPTVSLFFSKSISLFFLLTFRDRMGVGYQVGQSFSNFF